MLAFLTRLREPDNCGTAFHPNEIMGASVIIAVCLAVYLAVGPLGAGIFIPGGILALFVLIGRGAGDAA